MIKFNRNCVSKFSGYSFEYFHNECIGGRWSDFEWFSIRGQSVRGQRILDARQSHLIICIHCHNTNIFSTHIAFNFYIYTVYRPLFTYFWFPLSSLYSSHFYFFYLHLFPFVANHYNFWVMHCIDCLGSSEFRQSFSFPKVFGCIPVCILMYPNVSISIYSWTVIVNYHNDFIIVFPQWPYSFFFFFVEHHLKHILFYAVLFVVCACAFVFVLVKNKTKQNNLSFIFQ